MNAKKLILGFIICALCAFVAAGNRLWAFDSGTPTIVENAAYQSTGSGNWSTPATWSPAAIPQSGDTVTINSGHTIALTGTGTCGMLTVAGGTLKLDALYEAVTLTVGSTLNNSGTVRFENAFINTAAITATGPAVLLGNLPDWNSQSQCRFGGFTLPTNVQWSIIGTPTITMVGSLTATAGVNINSGATLRQKEGTRLSISGGNFWINGYFDMEAWTTHSYVIIDGGSNDQSNYFNVPYRIHITASGFISATGTSDTARCVFMKSTPMTDTQKSSSIYFNDGASGLLKWCDMTRLHSVQLQYWNVSGTLPPGEVDNGWNAVINANLINGANDAGLSTEGRAIEGLFIDNCKIAFGRCGIRIWQSEGIKITNTEVKLAWNGIVIYRDSGNPNYILKNIKVYNCGVNGLLLNYRPTSQYPIIGLEAWSNGWCGIALYNMYDQGNDGLVLRDCTFGQYGSNGNGDLTTQGYRGNLNGRFVLYNCKLMSQWEVNTQVLDSNFYYPEWGTLWFSHIYGNGANTQSIISFKHDGTDGLVRCWGDVRVWRHEEFRKLRTDKDLFSSGTTGWGDAYSGSNDAGKQKIIEVDSKCYGWNLTSLIVARLRLGSTDASVEMPSDVYIEWVGTSALPVICRGLYSTNTYANTQPYEIYTNGSASAKCYFGAKYVVFENMIRGLQIDTNGRISPTSTADTGEQGIDYCTFRNNQGYNTSFDSRHLAIWTDAAAPDQFNYITATGCSFDTSAYKNVGIWNGNQITFTNWANPRAEFEATLNSGVKTYIVTASAQGVNYTNANAPWDVRNAVPDGVRWYTNYADTSGPMKFRSTATANLSLGDVGYWQWENPPGTWVTADRPITSGDMVLILAGHTVTVPVTDTDKAWGCKSIQIDSGGVLQFNMATGTAATGVCTLALDEGGVIWNSGTINFANANGPAGRKVVIKVNSPPSKDKPAPWKYMNAGTITWQPASGTNLNIELGDGDWGQAMTLNPASTMTMTFISNMITRGVTIGTTGAENWNRLKFTPPVSPALKKTWIVNEGDITVGSDTTDTIMDGVLELGPNTETRINSYWYSDPGCYGIRLNGRGVMTATGTSSVQRDCTITANSTHFTFIRAVNNALLRMQYCTLSKMGWDSSYRGGCVSLYNINGDAAKSGVLVDSCTMSDCYAGFRLESSVNHNKQSGKDFGFTNNKIYNVSGYGIYLQTANDNNYFYNNEIYDGLTGILWNSTSNDLNWFEGNTVYNMWATGMYFAADSNGGTGASQYMPSSSNIFKNECYYNNGSRWMGEGQLGGAMAFWDGSSNNYHIFDDCVFGKDRSSVLKPNYPADIYMRRPNDQWWAFQFRNCKFASDEAPVSQVIQGPGTPLRVPAEIYWEQGAGYNRPNIGVSQNYYGGIFSYCHDKVPGLTKIYGMLFVPTGSTHNFNYQNASRSSEFGLLSTPDSNIQKQLVMCGIPVPSMVGYNDKLGIWVQNATSAVLNMNSGNDATRPTIVTTDENLNATNWFGIRVYGTIQANYVNFSRLGTTGVITATPTYPTGGLYISGGNARTPTFGNLSFSNMFPTGRALVFESATSLGMTTYSGCSFDNSALADVAVSGATALTFNNFANDYPGTKDQLYNSGSVVWQVNSASSTAGGGSWSAPATWGGAVPSDWANITINGPVSVSGTIRANAITITSAGELRLDASLVPTTIYLPANGQIINNGLIKVTSSTQAILLTSSSSNIMWALSGTGNFDLNGMALSMGLVDCQMPITVNGTLTIVNDIITRGVTIASGTVFHQTSGKFWWCQGDLTVAGNLKLGLNTQLKFSCASDGQYGLIVESTGYVEALGSSDILRNCYITRLGNYNPYIYLKQGSEAKFQFANLSYLGAPPTAGAERQGIYAQNITGGSGEGLRIDSCDISYNYRGIVLDGCTNSNTTRGITNTKISNCTDSGLVILGATGNNLIDRNTIVNNTVAGVLLGAGSRSNQALSNLAVSGNPKGVRVQSDSGDQADLITDSTISGSSTADIYFEPNLNGTQQLNLRNTTLGSTTQMVTSDKSGNSIISRRHGGVAGVTAFAGDIVISGLKRFSYAEESYAGDGDAGVRKYLRFQPAHPNFNGGKSRFKVPVGSTLEIAGTASDPVTLEKLAPANEWTIITEGGGAISATYAAFKNLDTSGVNIGTTGVLANMDNCSFSAVQTGGTHLTVNTGIDKAISGCTFDNSGTYAISANSNGITPTTLRMTNYTTPGFGAGTKDQEQNGSTIIWQSTISLTNSSSVDMTTGDFYYGDQNKPLMKLKLGPISPVGSNHSEKILKKIKVWIGGQYFKDSDISAVKIFRDADLDDAFSPLTDTLISSGIDTLTSGVIDITLIPAQVLTGTFFVTVDFSDTADTDTKVRGEIKNADYFTLESPHQMTAFSFIPASSANRKVFSSASRADVHIKRSIDSSYIGDNVYNLSGNGQTAIRNTNNDITVTYNIRIQNDSASAVDYFWIKGSAGVSGWTVSYYNESGGAEISAGIVSVDGWRCPQSGNLNPGQTYLIRAEVTPAGQALDAYRDITVTAIAAGNTFDAFRDMVKATTYVKPYMPDAQAKVLGGNYSGNDIYDPSQEQLLSGLVTINHTTTYYVKVENDGTNASSFVITGTTTPAGWTVSYYNNDTGAEITSNMTGSGWNTGALNPMLSATGTSKVIRMEIKPGQYTVGGEQITLLVRARASGDTTKTDQVKIQLTVTGNFQPDVQAKKQADSDTSYLRNDAPYEDGVTTTQNITKEQREDEPFVTYYVRIQNDGSFSDSFSVTGTAGGGGSGGSMWAISYYAGATDITSQVTGSGWITSSLAPGSYSTIIAMVSHTLGEVGDYKYAFVQAKSLTQSGKVDAVKLITSIASIYISDGLISNDGMVWEGENRREDIASDLQKADQTILPNTTAIYYVKIENDAIGIPDSYTVTGDASGSGWTVIYYDKDGNDITSAVTDIGNGWSTGTLAGNGGAITMTVNVSYDPAVAQPNETHNTFVYINSYAVQEKRDSVKAVTKTHTYQPDIQIKLEGGSYQYNGTPYGTDPSTQNIGPDWIGNNQAITYYYKIENDGSATASGGYRLTATAEPANWTIRYFRDVNNNSPAVTTDDVEITSDITNQTNGWMTPALTTATGGAAIIYARIIPSSLVAGDTQLPIAVTALYPTYWGQADAAQATVAINSRYSVDLSVKASGGNYIGETAYYPPVQFDPAVNQSVTRNNTVTYYVKIMNEGNVDTTFVITGTAGGGANGGTWTVKYFDQSGTNQTADVTSYPTGWTTPNITFGTFIEMRIEVTPDDAVLGSTSYEVRVHGARPGAQDYVAVTTTVNTAYQPDVWASNDDNTYVGDNGYTPPSVISTTAQSAGRNQTVTYYVKILNDSNVNDTFTVTGSAVPAGWTVSYYVDESGSWVVRTTEILNASYNTPILNYGGSAFTKIKVWVTPGNNVTATSKANVYISALSKNSPVDKRDAVLLETTCAADYQVDMLIRSYTETGYSGNAFIGDPVTNPDEIKAQNTNNSQIATYYVRIENEGNDNTTFSVSATGTPVGWTINYRHNLAAPSDENGTDVFTPGITTFDLLPNEVKIIRMEITPSSSVPGNDMREINIAVAKSDDVAFRDSVSAKTTVSRGYQADVMVRKWDEADVDGSYTRNGSPYELYNPPSSPVSQYKAGTGSATAAITYYVRIQNDGNTDDTITISGTGAWNGSRGVLGSWGTVTYYDVTAGELGTDITQSILDGSHPGWALQKFAGNEAKVKIEVIPDDILAQSGDYYDVYLVANSSNGGAAKRDSIKTSTVKVGPYLPDMYIMSDGEGTQSNKNDAAYLRNGTPYQNSSTTDQVKTQTIANRPTLQTATYYIMLEQDGDAITDDITISGPGDTSFGGGNWTVRYYNVTGGEPGIDISGDVATTGYTFTGLDSGATRLVRLVVTPDMSVSGSTTLPVTVTATSVGGPTKIDAVIARTTISNNYQSDVLVSSDGVSYNRDGVAYQSSATTDQTPPSGGLTKDRYDIATYYIKIQNDGNIQADIVVTGTAGTANFNDLYGWTVSYYNSADGSDITGNIIGSGWINNYTVNQLRTITATVISRKYTAPANPKLIVVRAWATQDNSEDAVKATTTVNATYQADAWLKEQSGTYIGDDDIYETTVSTQVNLLNVERLQPATYYITLQNDGNSAADINIASTDGNANWTIRFYDGLANITPAVTSTGLAYNLAPDATKEITLVVTPGYNTSGNDTFPVTMTITSLQGGGTDQIRATTKVLFTYQPDGIVATQPDFSDGAGDGVYSPTAQSRIQTAANNIAVSYYVRLQNEGNAADNFTISGTAGDSNWTISYYSASADITDLVVAGLYNTGSVAKDSTLVPDIRIEAKAVPTVTGSDSKDIIVRVTSVNNPVKGDMVTARLAVSVNLKPDIMVSSDSGFMPSTGDDKYTPPDSIGDQAISQTATYALPVVTYYVMIQNDGNTSDSYTVTSSAIPVSATWQVEFGAPISVTLTAGQSLSVSGAWSSLNKGVYSSAIPVVIKALAGTPAQDKLTLDIADYSSADATKRDMVRIETIFSSYYCLDVLAMKEGDGNGNPSDKTNYQFDAVYDPITQTSNSLIDNIQTLTYYVRVENDGAQSDSFTLQGIGSATGWTVSYYKLDDTDITTSVVTGTFTTSSLSAYNGQETIKVLVTALANLTSGTSYPITITARSNAQPTVTDAITLINTVKANYKVDLSVKGSGSYVGDGAYGIDVNTQTVTQTVANSATVSYYIKIDNDGNTQDTVTITANSPGTDSNGWAVSYYDAITFGEITSLPFTTTLSAFSSCEMIIRITAGSALQAYTLKDADITVLSASSSATSDTVRARAQVALTIRTDLIIRSDTEFTSGQDGDNIYRPTEADILDDDVQHRKHAVGLNEPTTYYIRIQNDGNYADTYLITGTASSSDWTVRYYDETGVNISDLVNGAGWTSSPVSVSGNTLIRITVLPLPTVISDASYMVYLRASSTTNSALADTVKTTTKYMPLEIDYPRSNKMVPQKPVVMGDAKPSVTINIINAKTGEVLGQTTTDINGRYRLKLPNNIPVGTVISLKPFSADGTEGVTINNLTVSDSPSSDDVPVLSEPITGTIVRGGRTTIKGYAKPGSEVTVQANVETKGQTTLYDFNIITATAGSNGYYEITVQLKGGMRSVSVGCDGGISDIIDLVFVDPTGIVYDSVTSEPIKNAIVTLEYNHPVSGWMTARMGTEIGSPATVNNGDNPIEPNTNPWTTGSNGLYQWNVIAGDYRLKVSHPNYTFPGSIDTMAALSRKVQESGVDANKDIARGAVFTVAIDAWEIDIPLDPTNTLIKVTKKANKKEASIGDVVTYEVKVSNESTTRLKDVYIQDILPPGFKYVKDSAVMKVGSNDWSLLVGGTGIPAVAGGTTKRFFLGSITAKGTDTATVILRYQLVIGSGALFGECRNIAAATYYNSRMISNEAIARVRVVPDPLFDYSTIIGKVFMDVNENGIQDDGELGMANVRIMTEDGVSVITDKDGKYHIAGIPSLGGQTKILKIHPSSLPLKSKITTQHPAVVKFTAGARLEKVNFGIKTETSGIESRRTATFAVEVTVKVGIPHITVGKSAIPLDWKGAERKELRLQDIALTMNEMSLSIDPVSGYKGSIKIKLDDPTIRIWARDAQGREASVQGKVQPTKLEAMVKSAPEEMIVVPDLGIALTPETMQLKQGKIVQAAEFKIVTTYPTFIEKWTLQILEPTTEGGRSIRGSSSVPSGEIHRKPAGSPANRGTGISDWYEHCAGDDEFIVDPTDAEKKDREERIKKGLERNIDIKTEVPTGYQIFKEFAGTRSDIGKSIAWDGRSEDGKRLLETGKRYKFVLTVIDRNGKIDQTKEGLFSVTDAWTVPINIVMKGSKAEIQQQLVYIPAKGFNQRNIRVEGRLYNISGLTLPTNKVVISTLDMPDIMTIQPLDDGSFTAEVYLPVTEDELIIKAVTPDGMIESTISEDIKVEKGAQKERVIVGLFDLMIGSNSRSGDKARLDALGSVRGASERLFNDGTYTEVRAAGFLKLHTAGDLRIIASVDTDRAGKADLRNPQANMFKYIDPDKFYPIYGDQSTRIDEASNTQGAIFLKVEKGLHNLTVGNYNTGFSGSELGQYNRSLYGAKGYVGWKDNSGLTVFAATARQMASHDELRGTGGSLYYLRHKDLMDGTEKVAVEVRDKISGLTMETRTLARGEDYEIDYRYGRIIFYRPVNSIVSANTIISTEVLEGNPVYVMVDYEYLPEERWKNESGGARVVHNFGNIAKVGATYVKETRDLTDYTLMGTDVSTKIGKYADAIFEYAKSESEGIRGFISYNGGLNDWQTLTTTALSDGGNAYKFAFNMDIGGLFRNKPQEITGKAYFQRIEAGFSSGQSVFQQGTDKFGLEVGARINERDTVLGRIDNQKILDNGNDASTGQVGASETQTATLQLIHLQLPLKLTGEFRQQTAKAPVVNALMKNESQQTLAARGEYILNKELTVFAEQQGVLSGKPNNQTSIGANMKLSDKITGTVQQTAGNAGNATRLGITTNLKENHSLYTNYEIAEDKSGNKSDNIVLGEREKVSSRLGLYREERFAVRGAQDNSYGGLFGADYSLSEQWGMSASYERSDANVVQTRDALAVGLSYSSHPKEQDLTRVKGYLKATTRAEYRKESNTQDKIAYLTANNLYYQVSEDMALTGKANYSQTKNDTTGDVEARFTEAVVGTAYRPVKSDKFNFLGKIAYLEDQAPLAQGDMAKSMTKGLVFSFEGVEDARANLQVVEKLAYRRNTEDFTNIKDVNSNVYLAAVRLNYRFRSEKIDFLDKLTFGLEYRMLGVSVAQDKKSGFVLEIDREVGKYMHLGFGYSFVDFSDDLTEYGRGYKVQGAFIRLTAKY